MGHMHMSATPPPAFRTGQVRRSSPVSDSDDLSSSPPPATMTGAHCGHSPGAWSSQTDSSGYSSPPSDMGDGQSNEWDLLSDMLLDDALAATGAAPILPTSSMSVARGFALDHSKSIDAPVYVPIAPELSQQQSLVHGVTHMATTSNSSSAYPPVAVAPHPTARTVQSTAVPMSSPALQPPTKRTRSKKNVANAGATPVAASLAPSAAPSASVATVKLEPVSTEEQKKLRRRTQIASSVQRHREKKKVRPFVHSCGAPWCCSTPSSSLAARFEHC